MSEYDIPEEVVAGPCSAAFDEFLYHWFVNCWDLTRNEVDLGFLDQLTSAELERARVLLRRNLHVRQNHTIEGVALLSDIEAIPILRALLENETDASRRLTMVGALSKLTRDPALFDAIVAMVRSGSPSLKVAHFEEVLWLDDERAVNLLIDLTSDQDDFVRLLALSRLNSLEFKRRFSVPEQLLPHRADYYWSRRADPEFPALMVAHLHSQNAARQPG